VANKFNPNFQWN